MPKINDLNLKNWKEHEDILTDSLWVIGERDKSGAHNGDYHGNFIPQIPNQLMRRFTKKGDVILDAFLGSGTTLIESRRLGRNGIGVELIPAVAKKAKSNISKELNLNKKVFTDIIIGDSAEEKTKNKVIEVLKNHKKKNIQFVIMHPPYHDIIKFSENPRDLCNIQTVEGFIDGFGKVVGNFSDILEKGRHLAVVIGDKYTNSEWVPLGFYLMNKTQNQGFKLKSILVKKFDKKDINDWYVERKKSV